jgi:hypothetical protein
VSVREDLPGTAIDPADLVRRLFDAEARRDLTRYRALLADEFTERAEGEIASRGADDAAYVAARSWALAPARRRTVDEIHETSGCVTVRYRLDDALPTGAEPHDVPGDYIGYSIYETREGHIVRAAHFFADRREATAPSNGEVATSTVDDTETVRPRGAARRGRLIGALTVALSALLVEPLWAAPVVATSAWRNGAVAFAVWAPVYFALGYGASLVVVRRMARHAPAGWFERLLRNDAERRSMQRVRRLVQAGSAVGFVVSSLLFGAIVTTWLSMELGRREGIRRRAALSSLIFSVGFVAFYAGLAALIF